MPRESLRHASLGGDDVDVRVAFVAPGEGDELPVGRELRPRFDAGMRREPPHAAAVEVRDPEVVRVREGDAVGADRGLGEEPRVVNVDGENGGREQKRGEERKGLTHGTDCSRHAVATIM